MSLFEQLQVARQALAGRGIPDPSGAALLAAELANAKVDLEAAHRRIAGLKTALSEAEERNAELVEQVDELSRPDHEVDITGPAHQPCRDAAARVCGHCAPALGFALDDKTGRAAARTHVRGRRLFA